MRETQNPPESSSKVRTYLRGIRRENLIALAILLAVLFLAGLAVSLFKNPNQMGVIESQSMNMNNMKMPAGAVPVSTAKVERREVSQVVTYTGSIRAFEDQDVVSRITAQVSRMFVYPGDKVATGQIVAQLDSTNSEYSARAEEARLAASAAAHNVEIARQELQQRAQEAQAAQALVAQAKHELQAAQADAQYWERAIARQEKLLEQSVISQEEYDRDLAKAKAARAQVNQVSARITEQQNRYEAAKEAVDAAKHHVPHQLAAQRQAEAASRAVGIVAGYTVIRASAPGVVTQRVVSPGVVVQPGQVLMRVAVIDRVRVQASVAAGHAQDIQVGDPVIIRVSGTTDDTVAARVTAVFPAADPTSRTTIVESLIPNINRRMLPGQYVVMDITTNVQAGLGVPTSALVQLNGENFVWRISGTTRKTVELVKVVTGVRNAEYTLVVGGLLPDNEVVVAGYTGLQPGMAVVATEWGKDGPRVLPSAADTGAIRLDSSNNWTFVQKEADLSVALTMEIKPAKGANNSVVVTITDPAGKPIPDVSVKAATSMPSMNMDGPTLTGITNKQGTVKLSTFYMSGPWRVEMKLEPRNQKERPLALDIEVL